MLSSPSILIYLAQEPLLCKASLSRDSRQVWHLGAHPSSSSQKEEWRAPRHVTSYLCIRKWEQQRWKRLCKETSTISTIFIYVHGTPKKISSINAIVSSSKTLFPKTPFRLTLFTRKGETSWHTHTVQSLHNDLKLRLIIRRCSVTCCRENKERPQKRTR